MDFTDSNFDISEYSFIEIKEILGLTDSDPESIKDQISQIKSKILSDSSQSLNKKTKIIDFLDKAQNKLLNDTMNDNNYYVDPYHSDKITKEIKKTSKEDNNSLENIKCINIDSRFRKNYYNSNSSDFLYDLPYEISNIINLTLLGLSIPTSIYGVNEQNNYFTVNDGITNTIIDIAYGNYFTPFSNRNFGNRTDIIAAINKTLIDNNLTDISYNISPLTGCSEFTLNLDNNLDNKEYQILFNTDSNGNYDLGTDLPYKLGWNLGFRAGAYRIGKSNPIIVSEGIIDLDSPKYLFLAIDDFNSGADANFIANLADSTIPHNILGRFEYQSAANGSGQYNRAQIFDINSFTRNYINPVSINRLHFKFLDDHGRIINFNNMDWSGILQIRQFTN